MERDWVRSRQFKEDPEETMELGDKMGPPPVISRQKFDALEKLRRDTAR